VTVAKDMKLSPDALAEALQHAGVTPDHFKAHFRADLAFNVLVQALNKGVEASEGQVRAELAEQGGKAASGTAYTVRQIIFAIPRAATVAAVSERAREAEQLRGRFTDCDSGLPLARAMNDVARNCAREPGSCNIDVEISMARSLSANNLPLALTQGDPSGIGPELTLKAWLTTHDKPDAPPFLAVANPDLLVAIARDLDLK